MLAGWLREEGVRLRALFAVPGRRDWLVLAVVAGVYAALVVPLGVAGGLIRWDPMPLAEAMAFALVALVVPALGEELAFRGALMRGRSRAGRMVWAAVSLGTYVTWHPLQTLTFAPERTLFFDPIFLAMTAILGAACTILRWQSGTLWTAMALHWGAVVVWQGLGQGLSP
jgi:uncharacterized protein